jgi:hypothetical protein
VGLIRTRSAVIGTGVSAVETATTTDTLTFGDVASAPVETTFITTQATADALAAYLANTGQAEAPLVRIRIDNDSDARLAVLRDLELGQRVIAIESVTGAEVDGFVEQMTHRIRSGGLRHECELVIGARTRMVGIYSPDSPADPYSLSTYTADSPTEPPPYATYGF